ncbi:flagellar basal body rod protein FlgF [Marinobacteraceae bacterium S3BR75-40.1]
MDKSLYIAMSGAKQNMLAQTAHANNLANVNTTGFKRDYTAALSQPVYGEHFPTRAYAMAYRPGTDTSQGSMIETGRDLDVAVHGEGWISVMDQNGQEAFTRRGDLEVDVNGILRTGDGLPVMGNGGPVAIPPSNKIQIGADGTISVIPIGGPPDQLAEVDRLKLVNPPADTLEKGPDGLMRRKPDAAVAGGEPADAAVTVESGFLEGSNVNPVESLIQTLELSRQYEMQVRAMRSADENSEAAARILQNL